MPSQIKMLENIQPSQTEIPSQLLLKWSTCSTSVLMISYEIDHVLLENHSHLHFV
jgi:hypothetical protein